MSNSLHLLQANWSVPQHVKTMITTRGGGCSPAPYNSFNVAMHVGDSITNVTQNRELLNAYLPMPPHWLNQTHSNLVIQLMHKGPSTVPYNYDSSWTNIHNNVCVVMTADCIPILITDTGGSFVGAIHAGWRGVHNNIIGNVLNEIQIEPQNIIVYFGPAICQKHFEVEQPVVDLFTNLLYTNQQFFSAKNSAPHKPQKYLCDLIGIAKAQLVQHGILLNNIYHSNECSYCNQELFYSYRRNNVTGRFASLIWLSPT